VALRRISCMDQRMSDRLVNAESDVARYLQQLDSADR
jgi:hypothetical protein